MKRIIAALLFILIYNSCDKSDNSIPDYFMTAKINDMSWSADKDYAVAQFVYNYEAHANFLWIWTLANNPLANGIRYQIGFNVNNPVSIGKFYFNNNGLYVNSIGGVSGSVVGWKKDGVNDYFSGHSINGFFEITDLTKDDISGVFEFTAVTEKSSPDSLIDTIFITNGKFRVPINEHK